MTLVEYLSSQLVKPSDLARALNISPSMVYQWRKQLRPVPVAQCAAIERVTGGLVTRRDLRPDDWHLIWPELAGQ